MSKLIYTYKIHFKNPNSIKLNANIINKTDTIEFCAENITEAIDLYNNWCIKDEGAQEPYLIEAIEIVYEKEDAVEYGSNYGYIS